MRVGLNRPTD